MNRGRLHGFMGMLCVSMLALHAAICDGKTDRGQSAGGQGQPNTGAIDSALFGAMKWRQIGPFRGGRVVAVSGVPGDPATWYFGGVAGGVWKSTNAGSTWQPVFDDQKIASIGA